ncbi:MAG: hypothetical protein KC620_17655, partial [Myxococcales bacterium]|nr:hypothetical protein [Myxococcales bacterium]
MKWKTELSAMGSTAASRRLPGLRFEAGAPPVVQTLPRMDVAGLVGFAARGPVDQPVCVEDVATYQRIFGDDLALAWDDTEGAEAMAALGPSVRAFFRNGGRRCFVVRVADGPETARFAVPGLLRRRGATGALVPASVQATSPGAWSESVEVAATLDVRPVRVVTVAPAEIELRVDAVDDVGVGDLLRVADGAGRVAYFAVEAVLATGHASADDALGPGVALRLAVGPGVYLQRPAAHAARPCTVRFGPEWSRAAAATAVLDPTGAQVIVEGVSAPPVGAVARLDFADGLLVLGVAEAQLR